jgi:exosortase/archaeosortase
MYHFIFTQDYEEIFIAVHGLLGIYKNVIIFVATIEFITTNRKNILIIMAFLVIVYFFVFKTIRTVEKKVIKNYYDYKYSYVRLLEESVRGATIYKIFNIKEEVMKRT